MSSRARRIALLLLPALLVAGTACNRDDGTVRAASAGRDEPATTTTTEPPRVAAPLTGALVEPADADRPAVSVKVDNSPDGRPQAGLAQADVVFEEKVEGGVTRFIAVYHSRDADLVGPIRSLRTTDPAIVSALGGVFAFSDGVAVSLRRLKGAPVTAVSERGGSGPFTYPKGKRRPFATYAATSRLRKEADGAAKPPAALFSFVDPSAGQVFGGAGVAPATKATVDFGGRTVAVVEWDPVTKSWLRTTNGSPHTLSDGARLGFTNVVVQRTAYRGVGYNDSSGSKVDEAVVVGSGDAVVLVDGKQVKAKWSKASPTAATQYTDLAGAPIRLLPGSTLVMLPPTANAVTVV